MLRVDLPGRSAADPDGCCRRHGWLLQWAVHADVAQLVEHHLAKVRVAGSNPVVRSREIPAGRPFSEGLLFAWRTVEAVSCPLAPPW